MRPETSVFIEAAGRDLAVARGNLSLSFWDQAARMAYYARFHAAQAMIFERGGKIAKTHKGVHSEFHRFAKVEANLLPGLAGELSRTYRHKEVADYDTGAAQPITADDASEAISTAECFVAAVR